MNLTGPQLGALFFLRDQTATGGAYAGNMRRRTKLTTLRVLFRLKLIAADRGGDIQTNTYVQITPLGRNAIRNATRPAGYRT